MIEVEKTITDNPFVDNLIYYSKYLALNCIIKDEDDGEDDGEEVDYGMDRPYVISPDAFADSEYVTASFWYFEDGILTDEDYNVIEEEDIEELVGKESLEHFGDYPDDPDTVYVRDDSLKVDYEICRDNRCYSEI